jgi:hypothetical protein
MKKSIIFLIIILFCNCKNEKIYYNAIKGKIYATKQSNPLDNVAIYKVNSLINSLDTINTNVKGEFLIKNEVFEYNPYSFDNNRNFILRSITYIHHFEKKGFKSKDIDVRNFRRNMMTNLDTIDLGIIYLDPMK